ncbi:MAG: SNF2-related protein [Acutalibacteraceae bacterium]
MNYIDFLKSKVITAPEIGFTVTDEEISPALLPHQREAVKWAVKGGRRALFESFGLGKTIQELEYCRLVTKHEKGRALIILPLGVKQEFAHDAKELLKLSTPEYVRTAAEVKQAKGDILITNYERVRDGDINPDDFIAVCLDEAAVLRSFGSKTYQTFLKKFENVKYKLVATATPDPNRYKEIIHYAGFLGVMDTGQALTRFFQRDSTKANNLTIYPHKETEFWLWVSSWALFLQTPADLGFDKGRYELPPLEIRYHNLKSDVNVENEKDGQLKIISNVAEGLKAAAREKRNSIPARIEKMKEIVEASDGDSFILWHDLEDERRAIKKALPEAVEVYGSQPLEIKEKRVIDFAEGKFKLLATKKEISGQGCNFQKYCHVLFSSALIINSMISFKLSTEFIVSCRRKR